MARNKIGLQFEGWEETIAKLNELSGGKDTAVAVAHALMDSKEYVNKQIEKTMVKANLPAKGKYSFGDTKESIDTDMTVVWEALTGSIKVGFDFSKSGPKSIFLMYGTKVHGTPRMSPVKGLKNAIYGAKTQKEVAKIQAEIINRYIKEVMEG